MSKLTSEIWEELRGVLSGNTLDALIPPVVFVFAQSQTNLSMAVFVAAATALVLGLFRAAKKQKWQYALGGLAGVLIAGGFAYLAGNATNFFLPKIVSSSALLVLTLVTLIMGKPLAAWVSHLSRGWELEWFWRPDVKPAYREVTLFWAAFFAFRILLLITLYLAGDVWRLLWANTLLGLPANVGVLVASYLYGIWRLRRLGGPGIEEYREEASPPWKGQTRGF